LNKVLDNLIKGTKNMGKKKKLAKINKTSLEKILEIKAILDVLSDIEQANYPANMMIEMAQKKIAKTFKNIEITGKILKITN
jgi:hypothetical protein